jgi:hypothetical protein
MSEHQKTAEPFDMRRMTASDLAGWGMPEVAFIKRIHCKEGEGWSIHAADGAHMGLAPSRELAFAAVKQHDLEPVSVH